MISRLHRSVSRRFFKDRIRQARRRKSRTCMLESLEQRQLLAADFQNPENAYEVTLDGFVAPIDALNIINDLNANGARDLREPGVVLPDGPLDVDGDYFIAPIDALMIINLLNLDFELPAIQARLQTDTGASDGVTSDSTIYGQLISLTDQRQLTVQVDDGDTVNVELDPFGNFSLDATAFPSGVLDGPRTFHLAAVDRYGMASLDISFTLDTTPAAIDSFGLHPDSDTAPVGDGRTEESLVTLVGMTEPLAEVRLVETDETIVADASGAFAFADVPLSLGDNVLTLVTTDAAENFSSPQEYGVVRYDPNGAPVVSAQLLNDTGDPEDGVSSEIGVGGTVASALDVTRFLARFEEAASDQYVEITGALGQGGSFQLGATTLADVLGAALNDGVYHLQLCAEDSGGNVSPPYVLAFERDTAAPAAQVWLDDNAAIGLTTSSATTTIAGQTDAGAQLVLTPGPVQSQADSGGGFSFTNVTLEPGVNHFTLQVSDAAGNSRSLPLQITRTTASGQIELLTSSGLASEQGWIVDLGQASGTRKLTFDVQAAISPPGQAGQLGDRLLVYLLDPQDPARTLLDGTRAGTALFALHADGAEYPQGLVSRVGSQVTIDLSSLGGLSQGLLLFQLLNLDATTQSGATIQFVANTVNPSGTSSPIFMPASPTAPAGPAMDLGATTISQELVSELKNVAYNSETGVLAVDLVVMNRGPAVGRAMAAALPTLPANVVLLNASGQLPDGTPYVNLRDGIPRGGLAQQSRTTAVRLEILNRDGVPLTLAPVVYSGGPNRAPVMEAPGSLQVMPGHEAMAKLVATDPDGDRVTFSIRPTADLPTLVLNANGELLVTPQPGEEGSYAIDVVASDGVLQAAQTLVVDVIPDTDTSSRLSGKVLDVDGTPLAGVPVSVGRLTVMTDQDGHFLIEFPSMQVPTEEFSIEVPRGDIYFDPFDTGDQLLSFRRARYDNATGTDTTNPRQHPNLVTSFLDASMVYGSDSERALALRMLDGTGRLKTSPGDLLPFNNTDYFANAPLENDSAGMVDPGSLFVAGDVRASENAVLASLHTLLVREHNRLADEIAANNPSLTDEQIHQQARRMVGAIVQNITYSEYLPLLLGADALQPYAGYQPDARSEIGSFFATVAFRIGHSQMVAQFERLDTNGDEIANGHLSLREAFFNSAPIVEDGIDVILRGAATQVAEAIDTRVIDDLRNFLFGPPGAGGMDLPAMSIQRAHEMGIPSYVQARADLGLTAVARFEDITSDPDLQNRLEDTYGTIDRIDAFVGGLAEDPVPGAMVGELFQAAIAAPVRDHACRRSFLVRESAVYGRRIVVCPRHNTGGADRA